MSHLYQCFPYFYQEILVRHSISFQHRVPIGANSDRESKDNGFLACSHSEPPPLQTGGQLWWCSGIPPFCTNLQLSLPCFQINLGSSSVASWVNASSLCMILKPKPSTHELGVLCFNFIEEVLVLKQWTSWINEHREIHVFLHVS